MERKHRRQGFILASAFVASLTMSSAAFADHFHGVIFQQNDDGSLMVRSDDLSNVIVVVSDGTKVRRLDGVRSKKASAAALIPGLRIEVNGDYGADNHFVAERVTFKKSDERVARAIQGGLAPTDMRTAANEKRLDQGEQVLRQQGTALQRQGQHIADNDAKIVSTAGLAAANSKRISNLDDYNVIGSTTVYFANGKSAVTPKYKDQIRDLVAQAKGMDMRGYVVQVQGYASAVGSEALNGRLSSERAEAVTRVLQQAGVPPTNLVAPAGMGTSEQVASNKTAKGQAENRRVVITLLQNKGISEK